MQCSHYYKQHTHFSINTYAVTTTALAVPLKLTQKRSTLRPDGRERCTWPIKAADSVQQQVAAARWQELMGPEIRCFVHQHHSVHCYAHHSSHLKLPKKRADATLPFIRLSCDRSSSCSTV
jgi:hypothetical protein